MALAVRVNNTVYPNDHPSELLSDARIDLKATRALTETACADDLQQLHEHVEGVKQLLRYYSNEPLNWDLRMTNGSCRPDTDSWMAGLLRPAPVVCARDFQNSPQKRLSLFPLNSWLSILGNH